LIEIEINHPAKLQLKKILLAVAFYLNRSPHNSSIRNSHILNFSHNSLMTTNLAPLICQTFTRWSASQHNL